MLAITLIVAGLALALFRERQLQLRYPGSDLSRFKDFWPGGMIGDCGALMMVFGVVMLFWG